MTSNAAIAHLLALPLAAGFLTIQIVTCVIAAWRCRRRPIACGSERLPPMTLARPLCGLEPHIEATLEASFNIDYPDFELLFCVADPDDPVIPLVRRALQRHPDVDARLLLGDDPISDNPKLNNMVKAWRAAANDRIVFADSNLLAPPDYLRRLIECWDEKVGLVSAPPIGVGARDVWGELECAFLNSYEARWQYFIDAFGFGFAQGKTLFYRRSLIPGGIESFAAEPAEDAATTKVIRGERLQVRLARPPFAQPLGKRSFSEVWSRQVRWARLRRATFPILFLPEILTGAAVPSIVVGFTAHALSFAIAPSVALYVALWYGAEAALCLVCGWPVSLRGVATFAVRDLLIPVLWIKAFAGADFVWKGRALLAEQRRERVRRRSPPRIGWTFRRPSRGGGLDGRTFDMRLSAVRARARVGAAVRKIRRPN
jgi:ceramide glucosyltransferase